MILHQSHQVLLNWNKQMNKFDNLLNKKNKSKIVCLTAYSKNIATILDEPL